MSSINANATVTLTVNGKQAQDMLDNLKRKSQDLEQAIEKAAKAGNKQSLTKLQRELRQTNRQIQQIESATVGVEKVLHNLDKATPKELNKTLTTLKKQLNGIERGTTEWNRQCEAIKRVKHELDRMNADLRECEGRWQRFNRILNDWQMSIMGAAAAVTGLVMAGRTAVKAYAEMDEELANTRKYTGMTVEDVENLNDAFKHMDTRTSRAQLNELAQEAGRLGKNTLEDVKGYVEAADIINVALVDLGEGATQTIAKITNIFGVEQLLGTRDAMLSVGSTVNVLSQNCTASKPYLVEFAQRMAGIGAQAKMTIPEILAFGATLDANGQKVEMSASALGKLTMKLFQKPQEIAQQVGLSVNTLTDALKKSTTEGVMVFLQRIHDLGSKDGLAVLAPMFKDLGMDGVRMSQVLATLAEHLDMVKWEMGEANKAFKEATSATREYEIFNNTTQASLDKAKKRIKELAIELGEKLLPVMRHIYTSTSILLRVLSAIVDFFIKYRIVILSTTAAVIAYVTAVKLQHLWTLKSVAASKLKAAAMAIEEAWLAASILKHKVLTGQIKAATAAQIFFNKVLKMNPLGLLVAGITAAVTALVMLKKKLASAREEQERLKKEARQAATEIREVEARIGEETSAVKRLKDAIDAENVGSNKRNALIREFNNRFGQYLSKLLTEKSTALDLANAYGEVVRNLRAKMLLEAKEKDLKENVSVRYGWEATKLTDYDKIARDHGSAMTGDWLKAAVDEEYEKMRKTGSYSYDALLKSVFKNHVARQKMREGYYDTVESQLDTSMDEAMGAYIRQYVSTRIHEDRVNRKWQPYEKDINTAIEAGLNTDSPTATVPTTTTPTTTSSHTGGGHEDKFMAEKQWKAKEEALNRIAYAKGEKNYEAYTVRMTEIEEEYHKKILDRTDLTEQERLDAQVGWYEAQQKQREEAQKQSIEDENAFYNEAVAMQKQRYIDGQIDKELYDDTVQILELQHLKRMVSLTKEGTKERAQAEKAYQDRLFADQEKRQKETEAKEKEHQQRLAELKKDYFGDNRQERVTKYMADLEGLKELYNIELKAAGDNAREKLRIEEAFQKARRALRKKYGIDELDDNKVFLEEWTEDMMEWLQSDMGKAVTGALDVLSSGMSSIFQQLTALVQAETDIQCAAIEKRYQSEISNAEGNNYIVKKLEKKKEAEVAKIKHEANKKMFAMQVIQAVAQTATAALNAYSSAAAVPLIGYILAPIAAASAIAAGMLQVTVIKKQQQASEAHGYAEGGFTPKGKKDEVAGVVHKGEWVASQKLLQSPVARPMIEALDYAQRTNRIGSLRSEDVSRSIMPQAAAQPQVIYVTTSMGGGQGEAQSEIAATQCLMREYASVIKQLKERLDEPFVTVNTVSGDTGIKQAQDEYDKLMRNKTPKSRRK